MLLALLSAQSNAERQLEGRHIAITATCAFNQALLRAGQDVIRARASVQSNKLESNLIKLGYPIESVRAKHADAAAVAYAEKISREVQANSKVGRVIDPETGKIDCDKLAAIAYAGSPKGN